jgi:hypothetical protein
LQETEKFLHHQLATVQQEVQDALHARSYSITAVLILRLMLCKECYVMPILLYSSLLYSILFWANEATASGKDASLVFGDLVVNTQAFGMRCSRSYYTCVWLLLRRRMRRRLGMDGQERHHPLVEGMLV